MKIDQVSIPNNYIQQPSSGGVTSQPVPNGNVQPSSNMDVLMDVYGEEKLKQLGVIECATCASRTYVDGSNDPGVSFKTPGHVSPEASASVVMGHEQEHVSNNKAKAQSEGWQVVSSSVSLRNAICPECGKVYVAGGTTRTTTKNAGNSNQSYDVSSELLKGAKINTKAWLRGCKWY